MEYTSTVVSLGKKKGTLTHDIGDESGGGGEEKIGNGEKKMGFRRRPDVVLFLFCGREKTNL